MAHHDPGAQIAPGRGGAALALAAALAFLLVAGLFGSLLEAARFSIALAIFVAPGLPLARRWFRGAEAVLAGAALGYLATSLLASGLFVLGALRFWNVAAGALILFVLARALSGKPTARVRDPREWSGLAATVVFCLLLVAVPFLKVGARVPEGVAYRAYFSADLMTHLSVVAELQKESHPPENPFYAGEPLGYYWLFFLAPAVLGSSGANQPVLLSIYVASGLLFGGLVYALARRAPLPPVRAFLATSAVLAASSYEGLLALVRGGGFRDLNVDAFARWVLGLVSLDGLHRGLLYTPQHLFSYSLLAVLLLLVLREEPFDRGSAALAGVLLGGMAGTSIVTAMLAGPWLVLIVAARERPWRRALARAVVTLSVALALLLVYVALGFFGDAGGALVLRTPRWQEPFSILLLDAGAVFLLAASRLRGRPSRRDLELASLAAFALLAALFLDLEGYEGVWMAWRAGSVLLLALGLLAAPALGSGRDGLAALLVLPAALTAALDVVNAQDVRNRNVSAGGFRWTTVVSGEEWEALQWIRASTPRDAIVQWDARAREPGEWAFLPAIAERRMAVGSPIFLLDLRKYRVRERRQARPIFASGDPVRAHRLARELGIDFLFLGAREVRVRGDRLRALVQSRDRFEVAFSNDAVTVLEVLERADPEARDTLGRHELPNGVPLDPDSRERDAGSGSR